MPSQFRSPSPAHPEHAVRNNRRPTYASDPVRGFFHWGARYFDTTNSHAYLLAGTPDLPDLRRALALASRRFELLGEHQPDAPLAVPVDETRISGELSFDNRVLRAALMDYVAGAATRSRRDPAPRLQLLTSSDSADSCIHLTISHEIADVKSGNLFMAAVIDEYRKLLAAGTATDDAPARRHPGLALAAIRPDWYHPPTVVGRRTRAYVDIARRMLTPDRSAVRFAPPAKNPGGNDFFHALLPAVLQEGIQRAARQAGVTINTVFSAALVRYIAAHQARPEKRATYSFALSLRKLFGPEHEDGFRSYMVPCTLRLSDRSDTHALLQEVDRRTRALRGGGLALELGRMENAVRLYRDGLPTAVVRWVMKRTQGTNIFYSNPGVIEEDFSTFGTPALPIRASLAIGCLVHPYDLMFYTSTFGGRTQLDIVYRREAFDDIATRFVAPFLGAVERIVADCDLIAPALRPAAIAGHGQ